MLWLTGLPAAGKTTIASRVHRILTERGAAAELLDGDLVRALAPTGFTRAERDAHVLRVGFLASRLERHGVSSVCALVSPYADARLRVREMCRRFVEVHVATPLDVCERRDPKGLYARARRGEVERFTGVSDPYEPPERPELRIDTSRVSEEEAVAEVLGAWESASGGAPPESAGRPARPLLPPRRLLGSEPPRGLTIL